MIQVIERIDRIIDVISAKGGDGVPLKTIEGLTGLNKGTLCNLLKSLCDIGYVEKRQNGIYAIGKKLRKIAYPYLKKDTLYSVASQISKELAEETEESALIVADYQQGKLQVIAKDIFDQAIVINKGIFDDFDDFNTATGLIILAFDDTLDKKSIYETSMKRFFDSEEQFFKMLQEIKEAGLCELSVPNRLSTAFAVPVFKNGKLIAALGMLVPDIRSNPEKKIQLVEILKKYGEKMTELLAESAGIRK
ncbi:MAG: hypothetical protein PF692_05955 [Kiritimatiellae bacterium]|jgi:DNA-binding IclR family transcriptional regulator|nr:hypothetical protein [Kiritimatiellia bacterium]